MNALPAILAAKSIPPDLLESESILLGYCGSMAHGMYVPPDDPAATDDVDLMNIFVAPTDCYIGLKQNEGRQVRRDQWDVVNYDVRKFVRLLLNCNPNVLSLLWLRPEDYLYISDSGQLLIKHRATFASKQAYAAFDGYAKNQYDRLTGHTQSTGFMGAKRKALAQQYGYDVKYAAHLIRLLRMGVEFLRDGQLQVRRPDSVELLEIKRGRWTLESIRTEALCLFDKLKQAEKDSPLPGLPDVETAHELVKSIIWQHLSERIIR